MSESERSSEEFSTSAELRSFIEGELSSENTDIYAHAGLVKDSDLMSLMNFFEHTYESEHKDMPYFFKDTQLGQMLRKSSATQVATNAVDEGNISQMKFISGKQSYSNDASAIHTLIQMRNKLKQAAYIQYMFGHMGNGKTDYAILQGELAYKELGYRVITNIKSLADSIEHITYVANYGDLLYELAGGQEVSDVDEIQDLDVDSSDLLFIFDEASSHASGYSDDAYETQKKLGTLVKKIRKVGGNMIIIGHTGKDVHPDIRRITNDCVKKVSKKTAEYYASVENAKGVGLKDTISKITKTNWNGYDTNEITSWDWSEVPSEVQEETEGNVADNQVSTERRNLLIAKAVISDKHPDIEANEKGNITYQMLADYYDITRGRISQIMKGFEKEATKAQ